MISRTLKDNQNQVLVAQLEELLPKVTEEEKHKTAESLLEKLKRLKPNPDQIWATLPLNKEEDELFSILCQIVWRKPK